MNYRRHVLDAAHHHDGDLVDVYVYEHGVPVLLLKAPRVQKAAEKQQQGEKSGLVRTPAEQTSKKRKASTAGNTFDRAEATLKSTLLTRKTNLLHNPNSATIGSPASKRQNVLKTEETNNSNQKPELGFEDREMDLQIREARIRRDLMDIEVQKLELQQLKMRKGL